VYLARMLADHYDAKYRAGAFFIALGFTYSSLFSCAFENVLPAGNDISSLAPKYISIKRAFFICQLLTVAICPWYLLGSASIFISFLASYQIFLFAITGILLVDYYIVSHGRMHLGHLYSASSKGMYWYTLGVNPRAVAGYLVGVGINFAGFLHQMGAIELGVPAQRSFYFAFITSGAGAGLTYYLLARFWPQASYVEYKGLKFKEWSQDEVEVYAPTSAESTAVRDEWAGSSDDVEGMRYRGGREVEKEDEMAADVSISPASRV